MEDLIANRMHSRTQPLARTGNGLSVTDDEEALRAEVTLPDTSSGRDTAVELAQRILRGLSLEFRAIKDDVTDKGHRIITEARMYGFGGGRQARVPRQRGYHAVVERVRDAPLRGSPTTWSLSRKNLKRPLPRSSRCPAS